MLRSRCLRERFEQGANRSRVTRRRCERRPARGAFTPATRREWPYRRAWRVVLLARTSSPGCGSVLPCTSIRPFALASVVLTDPSPQRVRLRDPTPACRQTYANTSPASPSVHRSAPISPSIPHQRCTAARSDAGSPVVRKRCVARLPEPLRSCRDPSTSPRCRAIAGAGSITVTRGPAMRWIASSANG